MPQSECTAPTPWGGNTTTTSTCTATTRSTSPLRGEAGDQHHHHQQHPQDLEYSPSSTPPSSPATTRFDCSMSPEREPPTTSRPSLGQGEEKYFIEIFRVTARLSSAIFAAGHRVYNPAGISTTGGDTEFDIGVDSVYANLKKLFRSGKVQYTAWQLMRSMLATRV